MGKGCRVAKFVSRKLFAGKQTPNGRRRRHLIGGEKDRGRFDPLIFPRLLERRHDEGGRGGQQQLLLQPTLGRCGEQRQADRFGGGHLFQRHPLIRQPT